MGYALFTNRKILYQSMINSINMQLDNIAQQRMSLLNLSANIADGKITVDEIASDPGNINSYMAFIAGSEAYKQDPNVQNAVGQVGTMATSQGFDDQQMAAIAELLNESLGTEYATSQSKKLQALDAQLDAQQKRLETKLTATQKLLESTEQAEGKAIDNATPKFAGIN